jgi:hypothetical protein
MAILTRPPVRAKLAAVSAFDLVVRNARIAQHRRAAAQPVRHGQAVVDGGVHCQAGMRTAFDAATLMARGCSASKVTDWNSAAMPTSSSYGQAIQSRRSGHARRGQKARLRLVGDPRLGLNEALGARIVNRACCLPNFIHKH